MVPRGNKNNAYAKLGGTNKSIMVFSEVAYTKSFHERHGKACFLHVTIGTVIFHM